jgi:catechol 2,3-dioxygenase-like lactoylglutathione lyase family enzyme
MKTMFGFHKLVWAGILAWGLVVGTHARAEDRPEMLGISHVSMKVSDMEKTVAFYRDFLGFAEEYRINNPKDGSLSMVVFKVNDDQCIQLTPGLKPGEDRLNHVAFQVADAEAWRAYLAKQGIKTPAKVGRGQHKNANFTIKDPGNFTLEFTQDTPEGWTVRDKGKFMPETRISDHISHVGVVVSDMPATLHLYGDILGLKQTPRPTASNDTTPRYNMNLPETNTGRASGTHEYLELMGEAKSGQHFCMDVPDVDKAKAKLEGSQYRPKYEKPITPRVSKNGKRVVEVYDPDGVRVEFME